MKDATKVWYLVYRAGEGEPYTSPFIYTTELDAKLALADELARMRDRVRRGDKTPENFSIGIGWNRVTQLKVVDWWAVVEHKT